MMQLRNMESGFQKMQQKKLILSEQNGEQASKVV